MKRLTFFLAFAASSPFTLYGKGGRILGRTHHVKFLRKQAIRLPDNGAEREEWVKQIYMACDVTTLPMPFLLVEDESKPEDDRYSHADLNSFYDLGGKSDPDESTVGSIITAIVEQIKGAGRLTSSHLRELIDADDVALDKALSKAVHDLVLVQDGEWFDIATEVKPKPKQKPSKKK